MRLRLRLNDQQLAVLDSLLARTEGAESVDDLVAIAIAHDQHRPIEERWRGVRPPSRPPAPRRAADRLDTEVEAGTGLCVPLLRGETLRVEQVVDGQCVDLNAFALHGPRRSFSAARTRMIHGLRPTTGASLWSTPPEAPLLSVVADSADGHDLGFPLCTEGEYERYTGLAGHPNCFDIQVEAQRAWGLTPADVHEPLNLWLPTDVTRDGRLRSWPAACRRGDYIELLAHSEVLVVLNPCADDLFGSSQYEPGPVRVMVRSADGAAPPAVPKGDRKPRWRWRDLPVQELPVEVPEELVPHLEALRARGWLGFTHAAVARALLFRWWERTSAGAQSAGSTQIAE